MARGASHLGSQQNKARVLGTREPAEQPRSRYPPSLSTLCSLAKEKPTRAACWDGALRLTQAAPLGGALAATRRHTSSRVVVEDDVLKAQPLHLCNPEKQEAAFYHLH